MTKLKISKKFKWDFKVIFPFLGLAAVVLFFAVTTKGGLFAAKNLKAILNDGLYVMLAAIGYLFLFSQGVMDFSIGANMAVSCAVGCIAANAWGPIFAVPAAIITGIVIGLINGLVHVKIKIDSFIATLAMMFILNGFVLIVLDGSIMSAPLKMLQWFTNPLKIGLLVVFLLAGYLLFEYTSFGKLSKAIGSCPEAVRQTGVNADKVRIAAFMLMGSIVGLLGFLSLIRTGSASNQTGGSLLFNVLNAALLGGLPLSGGPTAKFRGVIIGSLTMAFMVSGMTIMGLSGTIQQLVKGIVFLTAVYISFDRKNMKVIK